MQIEIVSGKVPFIRHFSCERDFYVFRDHPYKTLVDLFNFFMEVFLLHKMSDDYN